MRGVKSFGMICSAYDLGWMDEANGFAIELPQDMEAGAVLGGSPPKVSSMSRHLPVQVDFARQACVHLINHIWKQMQFWEQHKVFLTSQTNCVKTQVSHCEGLKIRILMSNFSLISGEARV